MKQHLMYLLAYNGPHVFPNVMNVVYSLHQPALGHIRQYPVVIDLAVISL
jgi:hypothetical protein